MRVVAVLLSVVFLAACSAKLREFDGAKGYQVLETEPRLKIRYIEEDKRVSWEEIEALGNAACRASTPGGQPVTLEVTDQSTFEKQGSMSHVMMAESFVSPSGSPATPASRGATTSSVAMQVMYTFKQIEGYCN